ncbi:MAG: head-tail connector protein [Eubacteriales bacterium]|nr:head-tail connector protein [Eubacteriales bacterium]
MQIAYNQLAACKAYMRIDTGDDDALISSLMQAAIAYLHQAGIDRPVENYAQYDMALWSLTLHYYDHRDAVGSETPLPIGLRPILTQMKLRQASEEACADG